MAQRRGPLGYVPARRGAGRPSPAPLAPNLAAAREAQLEASRDYRQRSADWRQRLQTAKAQHAKERGYPSKAAYDRAVRATEMRYGLTPEVSRQVRSQRYWQMVREFRDTNHPGMRLQDVRTRADFRNVLVDVYSTDLSPDGKLARALVALGRRDPGATYRVGETPR